MSDLTGALLASAQLLPFHSSRTRAYLVKGKGLLLSKLPRTGCRRVMSGGLGLWLGGWQCQAGTDVVLSASAPPPGSELLWTLPSLAQPGSRACLPDACGWAAQPSSHLSTQPSFHPNIHPLSHSTSSTSQPSSIQTESTCWAPAVCQVLRT